jgi:hypothetical protein
VRQRGSRSGRTRFSLQADPPQRDPQGHHASSTRPQARSAMFIEEEVHGEAGPLGVSESEAVANPAPRPGSPDDPAFHSQGAMTPLEDQVHDAPRDDPDGQLGHEPPGPNGPHHARDGLLGRLRNSPDHRQRDRQARKAARPEAPTRLVSHSIAHVCALSCGVRSHPGRFTYLVGLCRILASAVRATRVELGGLGLALLRQCQEGLPLGRRGPAHSVGVRHH